MYLLVHKVVPLVWGKAIINFHISLWDENELIMIHVHIY